MTQHSNEHLTTIQLSALLDRELAPDELALYDVHLQTCPRCQQTLADLRLTTTLLHNLPQADLPRSFVLPDNFVLFPQQPVNTSPAIHPRAPQPARLKRALRTLSTIAAVVGVIFILVGFFSAIPFHILSSGTAGNSSTTNAGPVPHVADQPSATSASKSHQSPSINATPLLTVEAIATQANTNTTSQPANSSPALDLGQPTGRLALGSLLLLLGLLGLLLSRRS